MQQETQETQEEVERMLRSSGSLTIDKLITQNAEILKKWDALNSKIDNIEKMIIKFIESKKEEISDVVVGVILIMKPFV
jgi:hypothetical protein